MDGFDIDAVDPVGPLAKRRVTAGSNVGDDLAHRVPSADGTVKEIFQTLLGCRIDVGCREAVALALDNHGPELPGVETGELDAHAAPSVRRSMAARRSATAI